MQSRVQHFINLTNGLEAVEKILNNHDDTTVHNIHFCRIQSSHCEANDFQGILWNLDHNLLMHLALGNRCYVYDFGSRSTTWPGNKRHEKKIPRAIWWGLEWSRYCLSRIWLCDDIEPPLLRGYSTRRLFDHQLANIPKPLAKKIKYYRKFSPSRVDLRGVYYNPGTSHDGQIDYYRDLAFQYFGSSSSNLPCDHDVLPPDFFVYRSSDWIGKGRSSSPVDEISGDNKDH